MERTIGLMSRRIKSKSSVAKNAGNQMVMLAAYRDLEKLELCSDTTMDNNNDTSKIRINDEAIFQLEDGDDQPQLCNPYTSLLTNYSHWHLPTHVKNYWLRKYPQEQCEIDKNIVVGTILHIQGNIFSSEINNEVNNARIRNFVQISSLLYDVYARQRSHVPELKWGSFYGELLMFFSNKYNDHEHLLCLVKIYNNIQKNEAGVAYGTYSYRSTTTGRLYVTNVEDIEGHCAYIPSAEYSSRYYYPIIGFVPNELNLGDTRLI
ncbi:hypothetical protein BDC45DRAFT_570919 [Circinella umbellata]|nr:hypothetical protein BDC45DRAFT_570919 [Circinella umbellata]